MRVLHPARRRPRREELHAARGSGRARVGAALLAEFIPAVLPAHDPASLVTLVRSLNELARGNAAASGRSAALGRRALPRLQVERAL
jgi:hypothetical protein